LKTGLAKDPWNLHILTGYVLSAGLLTRLLWGVAGLAALA
jgi:cytochrome b